VTNVFAGTPKRIKIMGRNIERLEADLAAAQAEIARCLPLENHNAIVRQKNERIEQLEAALRWEAAVAGDECAYETGEYCFDDKPESPDLWCTYCRIQKVIDD
jgi:multidrug resistance efflux pump